MGQVKDYETWLKPYLVVNTLQILEKEINRYRNEIRSVQLCFCTDPFMYGYPEIVRMSLDAIAMLNNAGIECVVLSKGVLPLELGYLSNENEYGISLVSLDEGYRQFMEPGTASYSERIMALKIMHEMGYKTWVSIEPFPFLGIGPDNLEQILQEISFVDRIVFGKINHYPGSKLHNDFYNAKSQQVIDFCRSRGIDFYIKNGTPHEMCLLRE